MSTHFEQTEFGFDWGAAKVERLCSDEKKGWVLFSVRTPRDEITVYVTRTGKIVVRDKHQKKISK